jgi:two-component system sensor histidine kinase PilS (NtrC family)
MKSITKTSEASWRALKIFSLYRFLLSVTFVVVNQFLSENILGSEQPQLFRMLSFAYLGSAILNQLFTYYKEFFSFQLQLQVIADIIFITLLIHTSGGISSGLGMLVAVSSTTASMLINKPSSLIYSIIASSMILIEVNYSKLYGVRTENDLLQLGILLVIILGSSLIAYYLSRRIRESDKKAEDSIRVLASMEKLNEEIIQYMSTGVVVVDEFQNIRLINRAAWIHLGMPESTQKKKLERVATPLARQFNLWRRKSHYRSKPFKNTATGPNLIPQFSAIGDTKENAIIFLDDTSQLNQQAQNLKLASLGRLTASIAHEIRNPLGALSHAAQLLKESESLDDSNLELVNIVEKNALRVNEIIENVMQLSIRKTVQEKSINLSDFLNTFNSEYSANLVPKPNIILQFESDNIFIHFDTSQLRQILTNLFDNGLRYSQLFSNTPYLLLMIGIEPHNKTPFIDVIDKGEGIPPTQAEKIFEPFFTTSHSGTGLGLYLSRELCEANRARLDYIPLTTGGSCFRISISVNKQHQ